MKYSELEQKFLNHVERHAHHYRFWTWIVQMTLLLVTVFIAGVIVGRGWIL